jgi:hypothetical protein
MSAISNVEWVERRRAASCKLQAGEKVSCDELLWLQCEGWDYYLPVVPRRHEPLGIPRVPHLTILNDCVDMKLGTQMFTGLMDAAEIESAIYRQCRIQPEPPEEDRPSHENPYSIYPDVGYNADRAWIFRTLTGHTPRDIGLFLTFLWASNPRLAKMLLGKDFKAALKQQPALLTSVDWPDCVRASWRRSIGQAFLPPFLACVLFAELARLSHNDSGMIKLSYGDDAKLMTAPAFLKSVLDVTGQLPSARSAIDMLIGMIPFQTTSLLPPTNVFINRDQLLGRAWSRVAASSIPSTLADLGPRLIDQCVGRDGLLSPAQLHANVKAHPKFWPEPRAGKGYAIQPRRSAIENWGLDRSMNAAVGLLEIATDARRWSKQFAPLGQSLADCIPDERLGNAVQMTNCLWLADARPDAAALMSEVIRKGFQKSDTGEETVFEDELLDDVSQRPGFGGQLLRNARAALARRAKPGEEGYTARSKAHLWFSNYGDDILHYRRHQQAALRNHLEVRTGRLKFPADADFWRPSGHSWGRKRHICSSFVTHSQIVSTPSMTVDVEAARCAQDYAMMITSHGLDPMRSFNARYAKHASC